MSTPILSLPYHLNAVNIQREIDDYRLMETDPNKWRMLEKAYLDLLGASTLVRHLIQVAVWQGAHPRDILVSESIVSTHH